MVLTCKDYHVGWICALPVEYLLAELMLDKVHDSVPYPEDDENEYLLGQIDSKKTGGHHNVVITLLPSAEKGKASAATVAKDMVRTFPNLKIRLLVGIAGGIPGSPVQLGDIVVGAPEDNSPGVIQYDYGKHLEEGTFVRQGSMNKAPRVLRTAIAAVQKNHLRARLVERRDYISYLNMDEVKECATRPPSVGHAPDNEIQEVAVLSTGSDPNKSSIEPALPEVYYGVIASGDAVIKDPEFARKIRERENQNVLCFEMEAAGLDAYGCLVIKGISDMCNKDKNNDWHRYASAAAAAFAKELLTVLRSTEVDNLPSLGNTHWNVPRMLSPLFTGRELLLKHMSEHLVPESDAKSPCRVFVLHGIGGAGKSEAAIRFATENQHSFWGIFWIDADNGQSIQQSFENLANMQIPPLAASDAKSVLQWLANTKNSWLLVLDNCDNIETDFAGYIPSRGGSVIVTTRLTECQHLGVWENVDDLGLEDAIQLLVRACGIKQEDQQAEWSHARAVVNLLGQHALALVHAGAYIKKGFCNLQMYCQTFRAQASKLMEFKPVQQASRYKNVYTTFEISAATLASSDDEDSQTAINLLEIFGLFDRENLESCVVSPDNGSCDEIYHLDLWHVEQSWTHRHPDLERDTRNTIVYTLASVLSENSMNQEVVPLLEEIYSSNVDAFSAPNLDSTLSALYLAAAFVNVGQNSPAIAILEPAVSIPNQNPFDAARSAYLLGTAYLRVGKHKEALFCFEDVMKTSVKLHEILGESTHLSIIGLVLTYKLLDMTMGMRDFTERMMDLAIQRPDNSEPVIMMHDVTTMNSALSVVALQSALTETVLSATELNVFKPVAEIDKILDRERKARKSLTRCFARQRSIWTKMQLKINQALEDYPLLDVDGLEHYFEDMMETEVLSPEPPDVPFSKIDFQEFRAAVYHCKRQACARTLMKLDDYLRPFGEDVSDTTQSVAPTWSEITIELEILHADVQQLYKLCYLSKQGQKASQIMRVAQQGPHRVLQSSEGSQQQVETRQNADKGRRVNVVDASY
ncbi:purine and uridine phosphorylase [Aureobasidium pullulans]|nr:purine and uridine phosphorylase [Aureobasidium pullulans]